MSGFADVTKYGIKTEHDKPSGKIYPIACKTWFTASGNPRPLSFKFKGDDDSIQYVEHVTVNDTEDKNYSGIPSKEYGCQAVVGGILREFKLIFYLETCIWVMVIQ